MFRLSLLILIFSFSLMASSGGPAGTNQTVDPSQIGDVAGSRIEEGGTDVYVGSDCYQVTCTGNVCTKGAARIYAPTSTNGEFDSFRNNLSGVTASPCGPTGVWNPNYGTCQATCTRPVTYSCSTGNNADCDLATRPANGVQTCSGGSCGATWNLGSYGLCQSNCTQTASYSCSTGNDADCATPRPANSTQSCTGGLCVPACTYPANVNSITDCSNACPGGPTRMCATSGGSSYILCPPGDSCYCSPFCSVPSGSFSWSHNVSGVCIQIAITCYELRTSTCRNSSGTAVSASNCNASQLNSGGWSTSSVGCGGGPTQRCTQRPRSCPSGGQPQCVQ